MKVLKKILLVLFTALMGCIFVGCLSTKVKVTYVVNGTEYSTQEYELDSQIGLPVSPVVEGKTFVGWYTDEALTTPYAEGKVTYNMTLYAKFKVSTVYVIVNVDGGTKIEPIEVTPGAEYTIPAAEKEGYTFLGYSYIDEMGEEQPFPLSGTYSGNVGIKITAKYAINKYDVTFVKDGGETSAEVEHNGTAIAPATDKAGYTFDGWYTSATEQTEETKFDLATKITGEITLYAKYTAKTFTITVNNAQDGYVNPTAVYGEAYTVVAPDRGENYEFKGFLLNGVPFEATGTYTWTTDIALDTVWEGSGRDILFYDGANVINRIEGNYEDDLTSFTLPTVPAKVGYTTDGVWYSDADCTTEFVAEGTLTTELKLYAKYTANTYKVTFTVYNSKGVASQVTCDVVYGQAVQNVPEKAERGSYDFNGYFYGETEFNPTQAYTYTENINVTEKWTLKADASLFEYNASGNYFTERENYDDNWTFVYLIKGGAEEDGYAYNFGDVTLTMVTAGGDAYATIDGGKLLAKAPGSFEIKITYANGSETIMTAKVVEYVKSFGLGGTNYDAAWGLNDAGTDYKRNSTDVWQKKVAVSAGETMKVGRSNFIPEVSINGTVTSIDKADVTVTVEVDGVATTDYTVANGSINFGTSLKGKTVKVTVVPKYPVDEDHKAVYDITLNEGVNVYANADFKANYANASVAEINVLRNIVAELSADQVTTFTWTDGNTYTAPRNGRDAAGNSIGGTGVYERLKGSLQLNGNYFSIDGDKIPYVDGRDGKGHNIEAYAFQNVQFSILLFGKRDTTDYSVYKMENLNVIGNGDMDAAAKAGYQIDGKDLLINSGACIGIQIGSGDLELNNVTSRFGAFALNLYGSDPVKAKDSESYTNACRVVANDCKFEKSWANNVYSWGFNSLTLNNSYVGVANGAAIHFDATTSAEAVDAELNLNETEIENWVIGTEAWFMAYNATPAVGQIKTQVDGAVQQFSQATKTIVKDETVNFAVLVKCQNDATKWAADAHGARWMEWINDATYKGYLSSTGVPSGQGSLALNFNTLDIGYVEFLKAQNLMETLMSYAPARTMSDKYVKFAAPANSVPGMGYMEGLVEIVDA